MLRSTSSGDEASLTSSPASPRQYISMMGLMRSNSTPEDSASSIASEWADSILKYASPPSGFWRSRLTPSSYQRSSCAIESLSMTWADALMNSGTASGDSAMRASARVRTRECCSGSMRANACEVSSMTPGMLEPPFWTRLSAILRNRKRSLWSILGSAFAPASKKLLTSRQPESTRVDARVMKAVLSSPMRGKMRVPSARHSDARS